MSCIILPMALRVKAFSSGEIAAVISAVKLWICISVPRWASSFPKAHRDIFLRVCPYRGAICRQQGCWNPRVTWQPSCGCVFWPMPYCHVWTIHRRLPTQQDRRINIFANKARPYTPFVDRMETEHSVPAAYRLFVRSFFFFVQKSRLLEIAINFWCERI